MRKTPEEILDAIPVVNESGDTECDLSNKNQRLMIVKDGTLVRGEDNNSSMNLTREIFS